ncbi:MAG: hypothetical protein HQL06_12235 [Nitrospirae bacterium]|nr:hypothetical protein [Nitrospirota bacterium]
MAKKMMGPFDELVELAAKFVEKQKGVWDHTAWLEFLAEVKKMGFETNEEMKAYLGTLLESMKKFYSVATSTEGITNALIGIAENTVGFVKKTNAMWDHNGWLEYIQEVKKKGVALTDETAKYLGSILESTKELYVFPPIATKLMSKVGLGKQAE